MKVDNSLIFPDLVLLEDFEGDFNSYIDELYGIFKQDFVKSIPIFDGVKVTSPRYPEVDGRSRTFYHITHEGEDENSRIPNFRRMERIRYPKFKIDNHHHPELLIWEKQVKSDTRIHILNEAESYLLVLTKRDSYIMLWTAFYIERNHTLRKKMKEYDNYKNAKTA